MGKGRIETLAGLEESKPLVGRCLILNSEADRH